MVENSVQQRFLSLDLADWIYYKIYGLLKGNNTVTNWQLTLSQATWALWLWRKKALFDQHFTLPHELGALGFGEVEVKSLLLGV